MTDISDFNMYVGNGVRSHRVRADGVKTLCGIDIVKAAKNLASPGDPGCERCFKAISTR